MKKVITRLSFPVAILLCGMVGHAQQTQFTGVRLYVESPTLIGGYEDDITLTNEGQGLTTEWGVNIITSYVHQQVVMVSDSLGCPGTVTNGAAINGKWALIRRGDCEFGAKAQEAEANGALGVFIYNRVPGEGAIGLGAGAVGASVNIPVIGLSYETGNLWKTTMQEGATIFVTITPWGIDKANDLTLIKGSGALYHAGAIPLSQLNAGQGSDFYKDYMGAVVANTGTTDATGVTLTHKVTFTPSSGGGATQLVSDSLVLGNFTTLDSVFYVTNTSNNYPVTVASKGKLNFSYNLFGAVADEETDDNTDNWDVYVTDSVFCKGRWNNTTGEPMVSGWTKYNTTSNAGATMFGPWFYVAQGGHTATKIQFSMASSGTDTTLLALQDEDPTSIYIFKWDDLNEDMLTTTDELSIAGLAVKTWGTADTVAKVFTVDVVDANGSPNPVYLNANSWYWVAVDAGTKLRVGLDLKEKLAYYERSKGSAAVTGVQEPFATSYNGSFDFGNGTVLPTFPFFAAGVDSVDNINFTSTQGYAPAVALHTSKNSLAVHTIAASGLGLVLYPNPATDAVSFTVSGIKEPGKPGFVKVIDGLGKVVYRSQLTYTNAAVTVPTTGLINGSYWFVYQQGSQICTKQFTVLKP